MYALDLFIMLRTVSPRLPIMKPTASRGTGTDILTGVEGSSCLCEADEGSDTGVCGVEGASGSSLSPGSGGAGGPAGGADGDCMMWRARGMWGVG